MPLFDKAKLDAALRSLQAKQQVQPPAERPSAKPLPRMEGNVAVFLDDPMGERIWRLWEQRQANLRSNGTVK